MDKIYKFDSGLTLFYTKNDMSKSTAVKIQFDCGARFDGELHGLSHFCEHCLFTGTDKLDKQQVAKRYFDLTRVNAYTTRDDIVFVGETIADRFADYLNYVADMICNSTFTKDSIEQEKKVVLQEIVRSKDDYPKQAAAFKHFCLTNLAEYKHGVLGDKASIEKITNRDVKNYVKKYLVSNNCYVYICSAQSFGKIKRLVKREFESKLPTNPKLKPIPYDDRPLILGNSLDVKTVNEDKNYFNFVLKLDRAWTDLKHKSILGVIANMSTDFGDGVTKELRIDKALVYNLGAFHNSNHNGTYLNFYSEMSTENINECIDTIASYINRIGEQGFSSEQFAKVQEQNNYYWQTHIKQPSDMADRLEKYREYGRFTSCKERYKLVQNLTLDEVNAVVKDLFQNSTISVIIYGGATKKDVYTIKQIQKKLKR